MTHVHKASKDHRRRLETPESATAWTPASPTDDGALLPEHWYDANQITGLVDGNSIATWLDAAAAGDDATQGVEADKPIYKTGILNGYPVARFVSGDFVKGAYTTGGLLSQPFTIFAVARLDAGAVDDGVDRYVFGGDDNTNNVVLQKEEQTTPDCFSLYAGSGLLGDDADSNWNVWACLFNGGSSQFWRNGTSDASGNAGANSMDGITIGAQNTGGRSWIGDIAEVVVYDGNLSTADKNQVAQYLADKYDLDWTDIS